jgi:hypothetical protein
MEMTVFGVPAHAVVDWNRRRDAPGNDTRSTELQLIACRGCGYARSSTGGHLGTCISACAPTHDLRPTATATLGATVTSGRFV